MNSTRTLVTGAAGLAGSAVVNRLHKGGGFHEVIAITRKDCDLLDPRRTSQLFADTRPTHVFHAAALVFGIGGASRNQGRSFYENTMINTNVIEAARKFGTLKITAMGSNTVYPHPPVLPYSESRIFDGRVHDAERGYANAKRGMLSMLEAYDDSYGLDYAYIVSGNLYGPRDRFNAETGHVLPTLVYKFSEALDNGGTVNLWGDGSPMRDFLYSDDLACIVTAIMFGQVSGAINIGSGLSYSIREAAEYLSDISGVPMDRVVFDPTKPNGRLDCTSDLTRLHDELGFQPAYGLRDGLQNTWDWYRENRSVR